jgi:tripartite-type tricarboxylate transporter receptor subunit TctC
MRRYLDVLRSGLIAIGMIAASSQFAVAQDAYPNRPIRLLVGFAAGGATDTTFRKLAELAAKDLGQPIVVENRPGAGATLAPSTMAKTDAPDGYTIAAATAGLLRYPYMQKVDWDPIKDFTWITGLGGYTFVLAVNADSPLKTTADFVAYAKKNPDVLTVATAGAGTTMHLLAEALAGMADVKITHVGYKGSSEAVTAILGGHTMATVDAIGTILPYVQSGKMRVLLSFDPQPVASLPGVPTAKVSVMILSIPRLTDLLVPRACRLRSSTGFTRRSRRPPTATNTRTAGYARTDRMAKPPGEYQKWAGEFYVSERSLVERAKLLRQP